MIENDIKSDFVTPKEIADMLRVAPKTVYEYIKSGKLPAYKLGRSYRIHEQDLKHFLERTRTNGAGG